MKTPKRNSQRFPPSRRILKRAEFQKVYHEGTRTGSNLFTVFAGASGLGEPARVGLTVTRKVGNAVVRNRTKRLLREAVRKHWDLLPDGLELIFHARRGLIEATGAEVEAETIRVLPRAIRRLELR